MYLVDTDVISEARKREKADAAVLAFFREAAGNDDAIYLSAITVGELRRGVERIRHRGDRTQADQLEKWLGRVLDEYAENILPLDAEIGQVWGRLRVPHPENPLDKQIAATALIHDLTLVTRNVRHYEGLGVRLLNPFGRSG
ncbi:MAG: type II toxin-antitoxin system VapC family toxin [Zoogloeaceae bacterium]|nr:type II toxin-antitoxin system VapC family toxin [Zoogloeaceae bacterium]MCK6383910.1 type II toxin-antitoxin system VapC family toxin [Rhodocyclaceae bacterium]